MKTFTYAAIAAAIWITLIFASSSTPVAVPVGDPAFTNTMGGVLNIYRNDAIKTMGRRGQVYDTPTYKFFEFPCPATVQFEVRRPKGNRIYWTEDWQDGVTCTLPLDVAEDQPFSIWTYSPSQVVPPNGGTVRADTMPRVQ